MVNQTKISETGSGLALQIQTWNSSTVQFWILGFEQARMEKVTKGFA